MIVKKSKRWINFLKTTAIGGLLFLLPLIVLAFLVSQVAPIVHGIRLALNEVIPVKTPTGIAFLISLSIVITLLLCFAAGVIAKWSIGKRMSALFEKNLLLLFPRYAILKNQMADTIGGFHNQPQIKAVLVRLDDQQLIGFETERSEDGSQVTVYCPGSPDTWAGYVRIIAAERVEALNATFGETVTSCEQMGRGSLNLLKNSKPIQTVQKKDH